MTQRSHAQQSGRATLDTLAKRFACPNCDQTVTTARVFCTTRCEDEASFVRYYRACLQDGRAGRPDIQDALRIRLALLLDGATNGQRIRRIDIKKDFDAVLLVLLDGHFDATEISEAERDAVITALTALTAPGSRARNERGALSVSKFKAIGRLRWRREGS